MIKRSVANMFLPAALLTALGGCVTPPMFSQTGLPEAIKVPAGHAVVMEAVGVGTNKYACRANGGGFLWTLAGTEARLNGRDGTPSGRHYGLPATWEAADGSKVTGMVLAEAAVSPDKLARQLIRANPATGKGMLAGSTMIQRVNTQGGVMPNAVCDAAASDRNVITGFQADYIFYKLR